MIFTLPRRGIIALTLCAMLTLSACSNSGGGGDDTPTQTITPVANVLLGPNETSTHTVNVPDGAESLTIMADGNDAQDMDISNITDPAGVALVSDQFFIDPIGINFAQWPGYSSVALTLPHSDKYGLMSGDWSFTIKNFSASGSAPAVNVSIYTVVKFGMGSTLNVNIWLVEIPDYQGDDDANLSTMLNEFRKLLGKNGITLGKVKVRTINGDRANRLTIPDLDTDNSGNGQPDDLDELFRLSSHAGNDYINLFLVRSLGTGLLGISGGIPGPQLIQGTAHSGIVFSTLGGLTQMSAHDLILQGETMAHEVGHYLGLFHTTESSGYLFDPISDTPECHASMYDANGDGRVSATECASADGDNLMFWTAAPFAQEKLSSAQSRVIRLTPAVK